MDQMNVKVCATCREHGRIVFADGTESREFWTKFGGFDLVVDHHEKGSLTQPEALMLAKEVSRTGFPRTREDITHSAVICPEFRRILRQLVVLQTAAVGAPS